jgi:5'-methylthioadenosine phosphorylase
MPQPFCPDLSAQLADALMTMGAVVHQGGTSITIEGPRFSTKAESEVFRTWGMSVIGMTAAPEAFLAREAEICYCVMAHVTDYDVWHVSAAPVTVEAVIRILNDNTRLAHGAIQRLASDLSPKRNCDCGSALSGAIITRSAAIPASTFEKLGPLLGKYRA